MYACMHVCMYDCFFFFLFIHRYTLFVETATTIPKSTNTPHFSTNLSSRRGDVPGHTPREDRCNRCSSSRNLTHNDLRAYMCLHKVLYTIYQFRSHFCCTMKSMLNIQLLMLYTHTCIHHEYSKIGMEYILFVVSHYQHYW